MSDQTERNTFASMVLILVKRLGTRSAADITDSLLPRLYPKTKKASEGEGCFAFFRSGVMAAVRREAQQLPDPNQRDFAQLHSGLMPYVRELGKRAYFVPELNDNITVPELIDTLELLDSARKYMRLKGEQCLDEANRLDALYFAVLRERENAKAKAKAEPEPVQ